MKKNRFIENYNKIAEISTKKQVDLDVATLIFITQEQITDWSEEKEAFDSAYIKWFQADFNGDISDYIKKGK